MTEKQKFTEGLILLSFVRATHEQAFMLKDSFKQQQKAEFNNWLVNGERILKQIEGNVSSEFLDLFAETLHEQVNEMRKALNEYYEKTYEANTKKANKGMENARQY